jgi:probable blue pigment (indigoidine) exporter
MGVFITLGLQLQFKFGTLLGLGAAISWSIATILIKKWGIRFNIWVLTAYQMLFGGLILLVSGVTLENAKLILIRLRFSSFCGLPSWLPLCSLQYGSIC